MPRERRPLVADLERRATNRQKVEALFRANPGIWIGPYDGLLKAGSLSYRSRVVECRKVFEKEGGSLPYNGKNREPKYMYRPQAALGRDASERIDQKSLF